MLVQTTRNIEKTTRTAREMAEVQRDSYKALANNFAAAQRRTIGLAEGGLEFMRLQEHNARTTGAFTRTIYKQQESFRSLTQTWAGAHRDFFSPFAYVREGVRTT
jgi:hypothetical protein